MLRLARTVILSEANSNIHPHPIMVRRLAGHNQSGEPAVRVKVPYRQHCGRSYNGVQEDPMAIFRIAITTAVVGILMTGGEVRGLADEWSSLGDRPLALPDLRPDQPCPISTGRLAVPSQPQIFGGGGFWFGEGPVFLGLYYRAADETQAVFRLDAIPRSGNGHRAKTGWAIDPSYSGPILIRGRALDLEGTPLVFSASGRPPEPALHLKAPNVSPATLWSFWPSSMWVPAHGCYGVQLDTLSTTDVVRV